MLLPAPDEPVNLLLRSDRLYRLLFQHVTRKSVERFHECIPVGAHSNKTVSQGFYALCYAVHV